jgi:hypothetical protein
LVEIAFDPLVTNAVEKSNDLTGMNSLPVPELEWASEYPSRLLFPLATETLVDSSGKREIVGDEGRGQIENENADQTEKCDGYLESTDR